VDAIGTRSMVIEAEQIAAASEALARLGFADFTVRLNHRQLLTGVLNRFGVPESRHSEALVVLDKRDKIGDKGVRQELSAKGFHDLLGHREGLQLLMTGPAESNSEIVQQLKARFPDEPDVGLGLAELEEIVSLVEATPAAGWVRIDPSLARGLSYYTGAIMEVVVPDLAGSLAGGGRYDGLIGMFLGQDVPACGVSLGLERILVVMGERGMFPPDVVRPPADVMVAVFDAAGAADALGLAAELRGNGPGRPLRVDVYPGVDKIAKQFKYAAARGIPFVVLSGDAERVEGTVAVKELATGTQETVARREAADLIRGRLGGSRG
jgi:histidyl-tRNA synthetase